MDEGKIQIFLLRSEVEVSPGLYSVSIRVSENSDFNACEFANKYGGGGHMRAAGCRMALEEWEQL
jgi:nanoRNase/pAp phosphatase (c-di-AMP/oligoRNAs hydrolase)